MNIPFFIILILITSISGEYCHYCYNSFRPMNIFQIIFYSISVFTFICCFITLIIILMEYPPSGIEDSVYYF
jgi:hypothetical protein